MRNGEPGYQATSLRSAFEPAMQNLTRTAREQCSRNSMGRAHRKSCWCTGRELFLQDSDKTCCLSLPGHRRRLQCFLAVVVTLYAASAAAVECRPWNKADHSDPSNLTVGEIEIRNNNIFSLREHPESRWIHRLANRLHIQTKESVLATQLLIDSGQPYRPRALRETERRLRSNPYIHSASVRPDRVCEDRVDIVVETFDNWSLTPSISVGRTGGFTSYSIRIKEANLLGYGKNVQLSSERNVDRDKIELRYDDTQLFGSRHEVHLAYQDNSDGRFAGVDTGKPFHGLNDQSSWDARVSHREYEQSLYEAGEIVEKFGIEQTSASIRYGWSDGLVKDTGVRYYLSWVFDDYDFTDVEGFPNPTDSARRSLSHPSFRVHVLEEDFIEGTNLYQMGVVEDLSLGHDLSASVGATSEIFGATEDGLLITARYAKGIRLHYDQVGLVSISTSGLLSNDQIDNGEIHITGKWFTRQSVRRSLYLLGDLMLGHRLYPENTYTIGGDTGLRGYPLRIQSGDRRFLFSAEQRYFFDWYPYRLVRFGAAVFADAGAAWYVGGENQKTLTDVGFGFRLVSTRQTHTKILHIDFAFPQNERDRVDSFQFIVEAKSAF